MIRKALLTGLLLACGCGEGVSATAGLGEPIRVQQGQFFEGALPAATGGPEVTNINSQNNLVPEGASGKKLTGDAKKGATAVAMRFADLGTGYWIVPVDVPDPLTDGDLTWEAVIDFSSTVRPGKHPLQFAASNEAGAFGPVNELPVLIQSLAPIGAAVISLSWDSNADLDLHVIAPNGKEVDPKHLTTATNPSAGVPVGAGVLNRDSNAGCVQDGYRSESLVFTDPPEPGLYQVRVDMFTPCAAAGASFVVTGQQAGKAVFTAKGRLLDTDADGGGSGSGLFVGEVTFN